MSLLQEMYEDIVESEESEEEDCFISDVTRGGYDVSCGGKHTGHYKEFDDALKAVNVWQKKNKYYPNIWMVSDHGNETLIDAKGKEIHESEILTKFLNDGKTEVLAKMTKYGLSAYNYSNRSQAYKKAEEMGDGWEVAQIGRPFYIRKVK
jgi:hypothetical protein